MFYFVYIRYRSFQYYNLYIYIYIYIIINSIINLKKKTKLKSQKIIKSKILFLFYIRYSGATPFFIFNNLYIITSYFLSFMRI